MTEELHVPSAEGYFLMCQRLIAALFRCIESDSPIHVFDKTTEEGKAFTDVMRAGHAFRSMGIDWPEITQGYERMLGDCIELRSPKAEDIV